MGCGAESTTFGFLASGNQKALFCTKELPIENRLLSYLRKALFGQQQRGEKRFAPYRIRYQSLWTRAPKRMGGAKINQTGFLSNSHDSS